MAKKDKASSGTTAVAEAPPAELLLPAFTISEWCGVSRFACPRCPFDTLDSEIALEHYVHVHAMVELTPLDVVEPTPGENRFGVSLEDGLGDPAPDAPRVPHNAAGEAPEVTAPDEADAVPDAGDPVPGPDPDLTDGITAVDDAPPADDDSGEAETAGADPDATSPVEGDAAPAPQE